MPHILGEDKRAYSIGEWPWETHFDIGTLHKMMREWEGQGRVMPVRIIQGRDQAGKSHNAAAFPCPSPGFLLLWMVTAKATAELSARIEALENDVASYRVAIGELADRLAALETKSEG